MLKCGGLGKAWHPPFRSPWLDDACVDMFRRFKYRSKIVFENLVLPEALEFALELGMSYWQRGGEASGLGELNIAKEIPVPQKRIYSGYKFTPERFDALSVDAQMELWRHLARRTGYRLAAESVEVETEPGILHTRFCWTNSGAAPCYERFRIRVALGGVDGTVVWSETRNPSCGCGAEIWESGCRMTDALTWRLPPELADGEYLLMFGLEHCGFAGERMQLANRGRMENGLYPAALIPVGRA